MEKPAERGNNGWVSCGIPANESTYGDFWSLWAASPDSRFCPCGQMVVSGPCPVCGAGKEAKAED